MTGAPATSLSGMQLADALCARICHDLSSPLGTLMGALEMATEEPDAVAEALPIASETAAAMIARLRLLRAAWAGDCGPLDAAQLTALAAGLPPRMTVEMAGLGTQPIEGPLARTILNLMLLAAEALPRGGVVAMARDGGGIRITVAGKAAAWPPTLTQALDDPHAVTLDNPRAVQAPLAVMLAQAARYRLSLLPVSVPGDPPALLLSPH